MSITTEDLRQMLRKKYNDGGKEWAFFEEVRESTNHNVRSCDAIAMRLWPHKGLEINGFEIKTSRSDWLNELRYPDKSQAIKQYCDRWWLVAASKSIVKDDLPQDWGMLWPRGDKLVICRGAPQLKPKPIGRKFLAALLRRASEQTHDSEAHKAAYEKGLARGRERAERELELAQEELKSLQEDVTGFQEASGLEIDGWRGGRKLGEVVEIVRSLRSRYGSPLDALERSGKQMAERAANLGQLVQEFREVAAECGLAPEDDS